MARITTSQVAITPTPPAAGSDSIYFKTDNNLYTLSSSGVEIQVTGLPPASGTVTSVSVVSANGFAGTVATATTTPAITVSTTVTGLLKGNGTSISAASAGTDYVVPSGSITGTAGNITATSNSTITTLSSLTLPGSQVSGNISGTATNVTASSNSTLTTLSALSLPATQLTGTLQAAQSPAYTGDVTKSAGSLATTLVATTNSTLTSLPSLVLPTTQLSGTILQSNAPAPTTGSSLFEDFVGANSPLLADGAGGGGITFSNAFAGHPGVLTLETSADATAAAYVTSGTQPFLIGNGTLYFETDIMLSALSTSAQTYTISLGWSSSASTGGALVPTNGAVLTYTNGTNSGNWVFYTNNGVTTGTINCASGPSANTWYKVGILINAAGTSISCTVNGVSVATSTATNTFPSSSSQFGYQSIITKSVGTSNNNMYVDYIYVYNLLSTPR